MAYNSTYTTGDFSAMVVDLLGSALFQVLQFVAIIVLIAIVVYLLKRVKALGIHA
jgi:flagellar biogenesis protein FliO